MPEGDRILRSCAMILRMLPALDELLARTPIDWQAVLDVIIEDFGGVVGTVHRLKAESQTLHLVAQTGIPATLLPKIETIPVGKGIAGVAVKRREPVELCNLQEDLGGVAKEGARATNVQGSLAVPIEYASEVCGALGVGLRAPHDFTDEEKTRLKTFANQIAPLLSLHE